MFWKDFNLKISEHLQKLQNEINKYGDCLCVDWAYFIPISVQRHVTIVMSSNIGFSKIRSLILMQPMSA